MPAERRWVDLAERGLARLGEPTAGDRFASARTALAEARKLRDAGKRDEAQRIWDGLEALYRDDPAAAAVMAELRRIEEAERMFRQLALIKIHATPLCHRPTDGSRRFDAGQHRCSWEHPGSAAI